MHACTFQITVFKQLYLYFGNEKQVTLNCNEILRVFHDACKRVLRVLYNVIYTRDIRVNFAKIHPRIRNGRCCIIQETLDLSVNAYDAFSWCSYGPAATDSNCLILSLRHRDTLNGVFKKLCLSPRAKEKSFHRCVLVVTKLRVLLSTENVPVARNETIPKTLGKNITRFNRMNKLTSYFNILYWNDGHLQCNVKFNENIRLSWKISRRKNNNKIFAKN